MDTKCGKKFNEHALQWIGEIGDHLDRVVMWTLFIDHVGS